MRQSRYRCLTGPSGLTLAQRMELAIGPGAASTFADDMERRTAWERHRAELMALEPPGRRPWAWWQYEDAAKE